VTSAMPTRHQQVIVIRDGSAETAEHCQMLASAFDVISVHDIQEARRALEHNPDALFLVGPTLARVVFGSRPAGGDVADNALTGPGPMFEAMGEGMGIVDADGHILWENQRLAQHNESTVGQFISLCRRAFDLFQQDADAVDSELERPSRRFTFSSDHRHFELVVTPAAVSIDDPQHITAVAGVLWEVTASRQMQKKIDAIDAAGSELLRIEPAAIAKLNMAERLKLLEDRIVSTVHDILNFDNFEIRLLDRDSNMLELVISVGLTPLKIGEVIYADAEGNGISGYVAASGESYICPNVRNDPLYREGLDNAASSLTVPLRLHDRVIGVFNIESFQENAFDENDRMFAEIFGRYIAMAMNILDLLVVERYTTNEQVSENVLGELEPTLQDLESRFQRLGECIPQRESDAGEQLNAIQQCLAALRRRVETCATGPKTILAAEQELHREEVDPVMAGKNVLLADNEPLILDTLAELLRQKGCHVTRCSDGMSTIEVLEQSAERGENYDLIISDIKMPDRNGYEIFRRAKAINEDTPVILMTGFGYDPHHSIIRASQEGLHCFLFKPFKATQLIDAVKRAFTGEDEQQNAN